MASGVDAPLPLVYILLEFQEILLASSRFQRIPKARLGKKKIRSAPSIFVAFYEEPTLLPILKQNLYKIKKSVSGF